MDVQRKLATLRTISGFEPIEGADAIEVSRVDGWQVVTRKGEFEVGELVIFIEVDSWVPHDLAPFLSKGKEPREYEGIKGEKLRTIKLRGTLSQGLIIKLVPDILNKFAEYVNVKNRSSPRWVLTLPVLPGHGWYIERENYPELREIDLSEALGIKKWEAPIPAQLAGKVRGNFPGFIRKTDQERVQTIFNKVLADTSARYEVTTKLNGSSFTAYHRDGQVGVCSRNLELKLDVDNANNSFVKIFNETGLGDVLSKLGNIAIQGEIVGPGIQSNYEKLKDVELYVFDAQNLENGSYLTPAERAHMMTLLPKGVKHVPILHTSATLKELGLFTLDDLLAFAEGPSVNNPTREGVVFKREDGQFSFKIISNRYLLKEAD